jgi:hypothetical protein
VLGAGYGTSYGYYSYGSDLVVSSSDVPVFSDVTPLNGAMNVATDVLLAFTVTDLSLDVDPASVEVYVQAARVYANETNYFGFTTIRTAVPGGYSYTVMSPLDYAYRSTVEVALYARDYASSSVSLTFYFVIEAPSECFQGPVNTFEETLLVPYTSTYLVSTEAMRQALLLNLIETREPEPAVRALFIQGYEIELQSVLRNLVLPPTDAERAVTLCHRASLLTVYDALPRRLTWMTNSVKEMGSLGLPIEHRTMLMSYVRLTEPVLIVSLMCFLVLLAKTLDK